jgi:hypothetical protein
VGREERELQIGKRGEGSQEINLLEKLFGLILKGKPNKYLEMGENNQPEPATKTVPQR